MCTLGCTVLVIVVLYVNACWVCINIYTLKFYYLTVSSCLHFSYTTEMVVCVCVYVVHLCVVCVCVFVHVYLHLYISTLACLY